MRKALHQLLCYEDESSMNCLLGEYESPEDIQDTMSHDCGSLVSEMTDHLDGDNIRMAVQHL